MKKILAATLLALGLLAAGQQQAQAWSKINFGVGLNFGWQGGGNSAFWGLVKGAQMPNQFDNNNNNFGVDGNMAPAMESYPSDAPHALPSGPEKIGAPTPLKPASYQYRAYQAPVQDQQQQPDEPYYPSYWYSNR